MMSRAALTDRQRQSLQLRADGMTTKSCCAIMGISTSSVQEHLTVACRKLGAKNTTHAVAIAVMRGIIVPNDEPH